MAVAMQTGKITLGKYSRCQETIKQITIVICKAVNQIKKEREKPK